MTSQYIQFTILTLLYVAFGTQRVKLFQSNSLPKRMGKKENGSVMDSKIGSIPVYITFQDKSLSYSREIIERKKDIRRDRTILGKVN